MDIVGLLPDSKRDTVAQAFLERIVLRYGCPPNILTDQGSYCPNFLRKYALFLVYTNCVLQSILREQMDSSKR